MKEKINKKNVDKKSTKPKKEKKSTEKKQKEFPIGPVPEWYTGPENIFPVW